MAEEQVQVQRVTFDVKEAAAYLGISTWLLYELIKRKEIHPIRAGHRYLFRQSGLDAWMNRQEEGKVVDKTFLQRVK